MNMQPVDSRDSVASELAGKRHSFQRDSLSTVLTVPPLPVPLTSFIGRETIATTLGDILRQPEPRLLTLTGPGGVGKTRLAISVAGALQPDFADGVGFISLAAVEEPAHVLPTIAHRLGVREGDRRSLTERLASHLESRRCLLVLDNFEQVTDAAPVLVDLLGACPGMRLLVTSRAPLRVSGEQVIPIPSLTLSEPEPEPDAADAEAVRLFVARAESVRPGVTQTEAAEPAIAEICARLDGLPLAIELAAARSGLLVPPVLLEQLDRRLPLLTSGPRDQPERLQTMRNAIAWSYDLLTADEQALFRCLSIFTGGFTLAAGAEVCDTPETSMLAGLQALVDQSLLDVVANVTDEPRYTMLETIREFGRDQLAATGEVEPIQARHARAFLALATRIEPEIDGPDASIWLARLDHDRPNLQSALAWLIHQRRAEDAPRLAAALWTYWRIRGRLAEGRDSLASALDIAGPAADSVRAEVLWKLGYMLYLLGEYEPARDHFEMSASLFATVGDRSGEAAAVDSLGVLHRYQGDLARARTLHERTLAVRRELGDRLGVGITLGNLGMVALLRGDLVEARRRLEESLDIAREFGSEDDIGQRYTDLGCVALAEGDLTTARSLAERSLATYEDLGDQIGRSKALELLGKVTSDLGAHQPGAGLLVESIQLRLTLGLHRNLARCVEWLAGAAVSFDPVLATRLLATAETERRASSVAQMPGDREAYREAVAAARERLGPDRFADTWMAGQALTVVAAAGEAVAAFSTRVREANATDAPDHDLPRLTRRETEVLNLVISGLSNREIAGDLSLSEATVKRHRSNIFGKLQVPSRAAAIARAHELGMVPPASRE